MDDNLKCHRGRIEPDNRKTAAQSIVDIEQKRIFRTNLRILDCRYHLWFEVAQNLWLHFR